jgi:hypothetical protein
MPNESDQIDRALIVTRYIDSAKRSPMTAIEHLSIEHTGTASHQAPFVMIINADIRLRGL